MLPNITVPVNFTTNGTLLNEARQTVLLKLSFVRSIFSAQLRGKFRREEVSAYLKKIFAFTRAAFEIRPDLYINYRIWDLRDSFSLTPTNQELVEPWNWSTDWH